MSHFRPIDRDSSYLLPPSVQAWRPEAHLARYVVEVIEGLDLSAMERSHAGRGSAPYHSAMLLALFIYGYATGCYSSRKIERATYYSLAFRSSPPTAIPTTTPWRAFGGALARRLRRPSCRFCRWPARTSSAALARRAWTAPRSTPTPAATARSPTPCRSP